MSRLYAALSPYKSYEDIKTLPNTQRIVNETGYAGVVERLEGVIEVDSIVSNGIYR